VNVAAGDDCIVMISGTGNVWISYVLCGPGHGIGVESLGKNDGEDVENIDMRNCTFSCTNNGLRIKTRASPLSKTLKASNFFYEDIVMNNVVNSVVIDQEYCLNCACTFKIST